MYKVIEFISKNKQNQKYNGDDIATAVNLAKHFSHFSKYRYTVYKNDGEIVCVYRSGVQVK